MFSHEQFSNIRRKLTHKRFAYLAHGNPETIHGLSIVNNFLGERKS